MAGDWNLREKLRNKNAAFYQINKEDIAKRATKLEAAGRYRTLLNRVKLSLGSRGGSRTGQIHYTQ